MWWCSGGVVVRQTTTRLEVGETVRQSRSGSAGLGCDVLGWAVLGCAGLWSASYVVKAAVVVQ